MSALRARSLGLPAGIALVTLIAYWPCLSNGFTHWDDPAYVARSAQLAGFSAGDLRLAFSHFFLGNYHPLSLLSLAADYRIGGGAAVVYHATSLLFHVVCTLLAFVFARELIGGRVAPAVTALLFGLHPLHVESVAWVSARKDVLYAAFFLAACSVYVRAARSSTARPLAAHVGVLLCFVLSLLSKGMAVAFAPTAVAIDWALGRPLLSRRVIAEKLPLFALALVFGVVAVFAQRSAGQLTGEVSWSAGERLILAARGFGTYLAKLVHPWELSAWYPYPTRVEGGLPTHLLAWPLAAGAVGVLFAVAVRRGWRTLGFGIAFYTSNVFFVLQWVDVGGASLADRYTYVASLGFFLVVGAGFESLSRAGPAVRAAAWALLAAHLILLFALTHQRCRVWQDGIHLWSDVIAHYPENGYARHVRGAAWLDRGDFEAARADLDEAVRLEPEHAAFHVDLGLALQGLGQLDAAARAFDRAIDLDDTLAAAFVDRGNLRQSRGELEAALADYDRALALEPPRAATHYNRGNCLFRLGRPEAALADYEQAVVLEPGHAAALYNRALAQLELGDSERALASLGEALAADPENAEAHLLRGRLRRQRGQLDEACADLGRAAALGEAVSHEELQESGGS